MNKMALGDLLAVVLLVSLLGLGCGQQGADRPSTCPVTGTVTHNGQPVDGATVAFQLADGSRGAIGVTDAGGKYTLTTFESGDGAVPGEYQVRIFKYKVETGSAAAAADEDNVDYVPPVEDEDEGEEDEEDEEGDEAAQAENLLPSIYADPATSNLKATVSESGDNTFDFPLSGE